MNQRSWSQSQRQEERKGRRQGGWEEGGGGGETNVMPRSEDRMSCLIGYKAVLYVMQMIKDMT